MSKSFKAPDFSVVLAVQDAEDRVAGDVRRLREYLLALDMSFEILAVNDGSRDNSFALLGLLAQEVPELRVLAADCSGRAFVRGAAEARGSTLLLAEADN